MLDLQTPRGTVILIGRVKIHKKPEIDFNYEIPLLSFVGIKRNDGRGYIATCIHLQIDGYGDTISEANDDMVSNVWAYLRENFRCADCKDDAWDNLVELFKSSPQMGPLWDKYHEVQISLAKQDIPTDLYSDLRQKIRSLEDKARKSESEFSKKVRELQAEFREKERGIEAEFSEKVRKLESELSEKEEFISWWIDSFLAELDAVAAEEQCEGTI